MARLFTVGAEANQTGVGSAENLILDGSNWPSAIATSPRSGSYCYECYATAAYTGYAARFASGSIARGYMRVAIYVRGYDDGGPPQNHLFAEPGGTRSRVGITSTGKMALYYGGTLLSTGSVTLALNTWYVILFQVYLAGASSIQEAKLYDATGTTLLETLTDTTSRTTANLLYFGFSGGAWNSANKGCRYDDIAINDATGGSENGYPDPAGKVVHLNPVSNNSIGSWRTGAGGTTNLHDGVDNEPPLGNSSETATTNIRVIATDTLNYNCDLNSTDYTTGGVGAGDTISLVQPMARYGNHDVDPNLVFRQQIVSNPTGSETSSAAIGTTAHGTELDTDWVTQYGDVIYAPSVTKGTSPVHRVIGDFTSGAGISEQICVDYMAIIVEYVPAVSVTTGWLRGTELPVIQRQQMVGY